jgi:hypothetical protein
MPICHGLLILIMTDFGIRWCRDPFAIDQNSPIHQTLLSLAVRSARGVIVMLFANRKSLTAMPWFLTTVGCAVIPFAVG